MLWSSYVFLCICWPFWLPVFRRRVPQVPQAGYAGGVLVPWLPQVWPGMMSGPQLGSSMCIQGATPFHWHRAADGQQGLDHQLWPLVRVTLLHAGVCFQRSSCDNVCGFGLSTDHPRYCLGPFSHQTRTRMKCLRPQKLPRQNQPGAWICMDVHLLTIIVWQTCSGGYRFQRSCVRMQSCNVISRIPSVRNLIPKSYPS